MKQSLLVLLLALCSCCFAQRNTLRVEPANVGKDVVLEEIEKGYQDVTTVTVTNTGDQTIQVVSQQVVIGKPRAWRYGTFNRRSQSSAYTITPANQGNGQPVSLRPGASASFQVVLEPAGVAGDGRVEVRFLNGSASGKQIGKATVTTEITQRNASAAGGQNGGGNFSSRPVPTSVNLFPNPARERFFVEAPPGTTIGRVEISNALGNRLRKYDRKDGKQGYDIDNLPDGLYLISIYDDKGKKLKTLRLLHRQFGA